MQICTEASQNNFVRAEAARRRGAPLPAQPQLHISAWLSSTARLSARREPPVQIQERLKHQLETAVRVTHVDERAKQAGAASETIQTYVEGVPHTARHESTRHAV